LREVAPSDDFLPFEGVLTLAEPSVAVFGLPLLHGAQPPRISSASPGWSVRGRPSFHAPPTPGRSRLEACQPGLEEDPDVKPRPNHEEHLTTGRALGRPPERGDPA